MRSIRRILRGIAVAALAIASMTTGAVTAVAADPNAAAVLAQCEWNWRTVRGHDGDRADLVDRVAMERSQACVDSAERRHGEPITPKGQG